MQQQAAVATIINALNAGYVITLAKAEPETKEVSRVNLKTFLLRQEGRFLGIDFVKLDGSERTLNGRLGVKSAKGGTNNTEGLDRPYLVLFDLQKEAYRTVNLATVSQVRVGGIVYNVID
jgi:hypothetical protein